MSSPPATHDPSALASALEALKSRLAGSLHGDETMRILYATDASEYRELPLGVAFPANEEDLAHIVRFAHEQEIPLVPRAAGTSLAGQVVGSGLVVDVGRHLNKILHIDPQRRRVRVQPGVVRNELNQALQPYGLFFAPETSTANRAMIGGMVGNNSCGSNSIRYGSTRDHLVSAKGFLSDGSKVTFGPLTKEAFVAKCEGPQSLENRLYRLCRAILGDPRRQELIRREFPRPEVTRRNTGYALDALIDNVAFRADSDEPFNFCRLIAGSEGTLFLGTEFELDVDPLPEPGALLCAHFDSLEAALKAAVVAMGFKPTGCELIDHHILECTKANLEQSRNRFFVRGDPRAVLVVELRSTTTEEAAAKLQGVVSALTGAKLGYAYPIVVGPDCDRVWDLRRAGQGIVNNLPGEEQPREVVEDTAVAVEDLPAYIAELDALFRDKYAIDSIYYAHAGAGELHVRPLFDLKTDEGLRRFRAIAADVAILVKKYRGSLSGEHGDGRLRGEFIKFMVGDECYGLMELFKTTLDPKNLLNPGKIIASPPMDTSLRRDPSVGRRHYPTFFNFDASRGIVGATEKCTGVGECRKSAAAGGTMCPSYMATRNEKDTTRARANVLREMLVRPRNAANPWDSPQIKEVMDLCLSCKACKSECPSNVDVSRMKAEWQQHYHDVHGVPLRSRVIAAISRSMAVASVAPRLHNWFVTSAFLSKRFKRWIGFAEARSLPTLPDFTLRSWHRRHANRSGPYPNGAVHLFCDEFTLYHDAQIGAAAIQLLNRLGYEVRLPQTADSGRAALSKGLLRQARKAATANVTCLSQVVTDEAPLIGIEPSAILGFRDEYPDLVPAELLAKARALAARSFLIDEFLAREVDKGRIQSSAFTNEPRTVRLHGHCHQKSLSTTAASKTILSLPARYTVEEIPSGCCGMAGSFGYEEEHFALSQQIGELVLFPAIRAAPSDTLLAAPGTSCRHQIKDATGRVAKHPVEILFEALA